MITAENAEDAKVELVGEKRREGGNRNWWWRSPHKEGNCLPLESSL